MTRFYLILSFINSKYIIKIRKSKNVSKKKIFLKKNLIYIPFKNLYLRILFRITIHSKI